ncbi:MAG: PEP-CTERM sorting domain-containing protein [Roseibacillus sp.]
MKTLKLPILFAVGMASSLSVNAAVVTIENIESRAAGPGAADVAITTTGGTFGTSHANAPWTVNLTVSNQNLDGDGNFDDSFTFNLIASTTNANGVSVWGQGINNSNATGTDTSFGNIDGLSFTVGNVVGTTTLGETVVFDGFTGATFASGGGAAIDRSIDAGGVTFSNVAADMGGFQFVQDNQDFASAFPTLTFSNPGGAGPGTAIARQLDLQFSTVPVPEPSSAVLGLLGLLGFVSRRRR